MDGTSALLLTHNITNNTSLPPNYSWYTFCVCYCSSTVADYILIDFYGSKIYSD